MKRHLIPLLTVGVIGLVAGAGDPTQRISRRNSTMTTPTKNEKPLKPAFALKSPAFKADQPIPRIHAHGPEGKNISPELQWTATPAGTKEFALLLDDPDAPSPQAPRPEGPWVHWVVAKIPAKQTALPENAGSATLAGKKGFVEGKNSSGNAWYDGPLPPTGSGRHRYEFRLYALDTELTVKPGLSKEDLLKAMKGHILGQAMLVGTYERK